MKVYLTDQAKNFPKYLEFLKRQEIIKYDLSKLKEKLKLMQVKA